MGMAVSTDYARMEGQRQSLVEGIADSQRELKAFIDLVVKIPKRKILDVQEDRDVENGDAEEAAEENAQEAVEDGDEQQEDGDDERQEAEEDGDADGDDGDGDDE